MREWKKERIQKKVIGIVLAVILVFYILPINEFAISISALAETTIAETPIEQIVTVDVAGTQNLADGYYKIDAEGTITSGTESEYNLHFDQSTNTLTLNNAIIPKGNTTGINFHYATNDAKATIKLIGENKITSENFAIKAKKESSLPSTSADVDVELTICGSGSLETSSVWGIEATNLTIDGSIVDITTGGHSALRIFRDLMIRNATLTTRDTGDGGDFYVDRSLQIINSTLDLSDIQVEYPSIYLSNTYCPDEYLIEPAVVIKESSLTVGGKADYSFGFSLYVAKKGAEISDTTLTAVNNRMGLFVANGALEISGTSTIETGSKLAVRSKESVKIGENVDITGSIVETVGSIADGYRFVNNGFICLPENITEEQLKKLHYYGGGTVKIGDSKTYHSVRFDLEDDTTPLDEIETQWILDGEIAVPLEDPEKDGFRFLGWAAEENSEIWDFENDKVTKSLLFSPQWKHVHAWNYMLDGTSTIKATCTANGCDNREQSITIHAPAGDLTYNGLQKAATLDGTIDGIEPEITYNTEDNSIPVNAGSYTASITIGEQTASVTYEITKAIPAIGTVTVNEIENTLDISKAVLSYTNQEIAGTLKLVDSTLKYGTHTYSWEFIPEGDSKENYQEITGTIEITVKDTIAPTAVYQIETGEWKKFINTISFGFFCKDYKNVTIDFTDDTDTIIGSGIAEKQYAIVDKEITDIESIEWKDYKEKLSLNANGIYFIYVKVTDNAGNTAIFNSEGIVIYKESTLSQTEIDYTYKQNKDCIIGLSMNGNTFKEITDQAGNVIEKEYYTIDENGNLTLKSSYLDTLKKGEYTYKIIMNPQGVETDKITVAYTFMIKVKAAEVRIVNVTAKDRDYNGTNIVEITEITLSDIKEDDNVTIDLSNIQGTLSSANAGTYTSVILPELTLIGEAKDNYILIQPTQAVATSVTIRPLDAEIIVGTESYKKTFGDKAFSLDVADNNEEADVQYTITEGTDIISIQDNMVMIKEAGTAIITVSLQASTNYNAAKDKIITVYVEKKSGYKVDAINKNYLYMKEHTESIDLVSLLPEDCGMISYEKPSVSGTVNFKMVVVTEGKLSYTLESGEKNEEGTITVIVKTKNYTDIVFMINVKLVDQIPVSLKQGTEVTLKEDTLIFGETLSKLVFNSAEFVDSDGNLVEGTLAWKDGEIKPEVGTKSALWIFTPTEIEYASVEGMVGITVKKAIPVIEKVPTVVNRVYNPSITLKDSDLIGGDADITGIWSWQDTEIVPSVNNSGYQAVFIPVDDSNYETVIKTIPVTVTKATPYIQMIPSASAISYGDTLNGSSLTKGMVQYSSLDTTKVAGSFTWKDASVKPVAADSDNTKYPIIFTPVDEINYNSIETAVTLIVNKAENAPNMPENKMNVPNSYKKVSDVELPVGWSWKDTEKDIILEVEKPIEATAIYIGEDKDNYKNITVLVSIIRSDYKQIPVSLKQGTEVTLKEDTLIFGETLSKLVFNPAEFVDSDGNLVEGTLTWKDAEIKPEVGTKSALWIFTPTKIEYASVEGMVGITVKKAVPVIEKVPTVIDRVYNPSITLKDSDLMGGDAEVAGIWSWQDTEIIPSVNNSGYQAVFIPVDDSNYETVMKTIPVTVTKATPYIQTIPSASAICYGDTLNDSSLTKGMVQYSSLDTTKVAGSFTWKDTSIKPVVADSDNTKYSIIFTPVDEINYNSIETAVTLTVSKAENAPNMPANEMNVPNSYKKVSDVELPIGWSWKDIEKDTILEVEKPIEATAIYVGEDKDNYKNVTVLVSIIKSDCEHKNTEQKNIVSATCEKEGYTGDFYCKDCGAKIKSGMVISATGHNYNQEIANENTLKSVATIWSAAVYFKSCHCGAISKTETFLSGEPLSNPSSPSDPSGPISPSTPTISTPSVPNNGNNNSSSDKNETNNNNSGNNSNTSNEENSSGNDNKQEEDSTKKVVTETKSDGTKVEAVTETKPDGAKIETITETKPDGAKIETITETKLDGSSTETKEITTGDNSITLKTIVETNASGSRNVNAIIYTGISNTDNTVEIQEELLNDIAKESELKTVIIEITDTTVKTAVASNKNITININIPSVEGVGVEKIVFNKDSIYTTKEIGKGLIVKIIDSDTKEIENNYKVKIPAKQLEKIDSSVEEINIMIKTENAANITNNTIKNAVDKILMKNKGKKKKTCVISLASNESINTGMKVTVPITEKITITQGSKVYVYKYDIKTKKLIETANHKQTVKKDGSIVIAATLGTDYIVSVKKLKGNQIETMEDGISVSVSKEKIKVGKKLKVNVLLPDTISIKNTFGTEKATIVYKSSDNKIVSISKNGMITAKKKGEVLITITIKLASGQKIIKKQKITIK